jgi:hypothetical protein
LQVFAVDIDTLQPVHFLDPVHPVLLQFLLAQHGQDTVRIARTVHQRIARLHALSIPHVDVHVEAASIRASCAGIPERALEAGPLLQR